MNRLVFLSPVFAVAAVLASANVVAEPSKAETLITAARDAMGSAEAWDKAAVWHETGKISVGGLSGNYETWEDLGSLHNTGSYVLGPTSGSNGWDGKQAWTTDATKEVRVESSAEASAIAIQDAYRGGYAFLFPNRFPGTAAYSGSRQADGKTYESVKFTPKGAEPFEIWFDPATHLVAREIQLTGVQPVAYIFSDFAKADGILLPRKTIQRTGNDPKYDAVGEVAAITLGAARQESRYAPPPPPKNSAQWPAGQDSVTLPFRLLNNHIYVEASINGAAPQLFVFDTGATNMLDTGAAKGLGIAVEGALPGGGFGDKIEDFGLAKVNSVSLGGLTLPDQVFGTENSTGWGAIEGIKSAGLLGYEFVKRAVLTIDYAKRTLTFTKQEVFHPPKDVPVIAFTFDGHIPMVAGTLDGFPGEFEIDTGSRGALIVMRAFADANGLVDKYHATRKATVGYGVGGPSKALLARAGKLTLGPVAIEAPVTELIADKGGAANATRTAGNIGGDLLKQFTVTFDYAHQNIWLQPNQLAGKPQAFDRSGLWISRAEGGDIMVGDVAGQSAAARIGLAVGDEIASVNGKPAKDTALYDLREEFKSAPGTKFVLGVKGSGGKGSERTLTLVLADQV
ncbi:MAG: aspartyl protease family protein [Collimonas sp.]|uniref:aspartyl protease family protein n=1 Tax=Collimonas sp. TaxID=1963772 RepID=UPI003262E79C